MKTLLSVHLDHPNSFLAQILCLINLTLCDLSKTNKDHGLNVHAVRLLSLTD